MQKRRYLDSLVASDLKDKMVFIGGPQQVGKTTFAASTGSQQYAKYAYLNWDSREDRQNILASRFENLGWKYFIQVVLNFSVLFVLYVRMSR